MDKKNILSKSDAVIVLYGTLAGDDFFSVDVNKDYGEYHGGFDGFIEFTPDLDELKIENYGDEYIYHGDLSQADLKKELESRLFRVEIRN